MFLVVVHKRLSLPTLLFLTYDEKHGPVIVNIGNTLTTYFCLAGRQLRGKKYA